MATMKTCYQSCCGDYDGGGGGGGGGENADDTFDIMIYMISDSSPCQCLPKARGASASRSWLSWLKMIRAQVGPNQIRNQAQSSHLNIPWLPSLSLPFSTLHIPAPSYTHLVHSLLHLFLNLRSLVWQFLRCVRHCCLLQRGQWVDRTGLLAGLSDLPNVLTSDIGAVPGLHGLPEASHKIQGPFLQHWLHSIVSTSEHIRTSSVTLIIVHLKGSSRVASENAESRTNIWSEPSPTASLHLKKDRLDWPKKELSVGGTDVQLLEIFHEEWDGFVQLPLTKRWYGTWFLVAAAPNTHEKQKQSTLKSLQGKIPSRSDFYELWLCICLLVQKGSWKSYIFDFLVWVLALAALGLLLL